MDAGTLSTVVGAGSSILGDIFNLFGSSKANRESRNYATNVMNTQRQWALQDLANQQEYNDPKQQMARLKGAGLNPNLVYGEGITATGQSEQPRQVASANFTPQNELSAFSNLGAQAMEATNLGVSVEQKKAQTENIVAHTVEQSMLNQILDYSPELKGFTMVDPNDPSKQTTVSAKEFQDTLAAYKFQQGGAETAIKNAVQRVTESKADQEFFATEIAKASYAPTLEAAMQQGKQAIANLKLTDQQRKNMEKAFDGMQKSQELQDLEIEYRKKNFNNNPILQGLFKTAMLAVLAVL